MSFAFCFDQERDVYHFAYCYPYTYTRLQNYLDNLEMKAYPFFQRELLTSTIVSIAFSPPADYSTHGGLCSASVSHLFIYFLMV